MTGACQKRSSIVEQEDAPTPFKNHLTKPIEEILPVKMNTEEYLGSKDVAWILDLSPDDVVELAKGQKLRGIKIGRFWRFRPNDVETYKKQQKKSE